MAALRTRRREAGGGKAGGYDASAIANVDKVFYGGLRLLACKRYASSGEEGGEVEMALVEEAAGVVLLRLVALLNEDHQEGGNVSSLSGSSSPCYCHWGLILDDRTPLQLATAAVDECCATAIPNVHYAAARLRFPTFSFTKRLKRKHGKQDIHPLMCFYATAAIGVSFVLRSGQPPYRWHHCAQAPHSGNFCIDVAKPLLSPSLKQQLLFASDKLLMLLNPSDSTAAAASTSAAAATTSSESGAASAHFAGRRSGTLRHYAGHQQQQPSQPHHHQPHHHPHHHQHHRQQQQPQHHPHEQAAQQGDQESSQSSSQHMYGELEQQQPQQQQQVWGYAKRRSSLTPRGGSKSTREAVQQQMKQQRRLLHALFESSRFLANPLPPSPQAPWYVGGEGEEGQSDTVLGDLEAVLQCLHRLLKEDVYDKKAVSFWSWLFAFVVVELWGWQNVQQEGGTAEEEALKAVAFPLLPFTAAETAEQILQLLGRHWSESLEARSVIRFCLGALAPLILGIRLMQALDEILRSAYARTGDPLFAAWAASLSVTPHAVSPLLVSVAACPSATTDCSAAAAEAALALGMDAALLKAFTAYCRAGGDDMAAFWEALGISQGLAAQKSEAELSSQQVAETASERASPLSPAYGDAPLPPMEEKKLGEVAMQQSGVDVSVSEYLQELSVPLSRLQRLLFLLGAQQRVGLEACRGSVQEVFSATTAGGKREGGAAAAVDPRSSQQVDSTLSSKGSINNNECRSYCLPEEFARALAVPSVPLEVALYCNRLQQPFQQPSSHHQHNTAYDRKRCSCLELLQRVGAVRQLLAVARENSSNRGEEAACAELLLLEVSVDSLYQQLASRVLQQDAYANTLQQKILLSCSNPIPFSPVQQRQLEMLLQAETQGASKEQLDAAGAADATMSSTFIPLDGASLIHTEVSLSLVGMSLSSSWSSARQPCSSQDLTEKQKKNGAEVLTVILHAACTVIEDDALSPVIIRQTPFKSSVAAEFRLCACRFAEVSVIAGDWSALDGEAVECHHSCQGCCSRRLIAHGKREAAVHTAAGAKDREAARESHVALQRLLRRALLERLGRAIGRLVDLSQEHFKEKLLFFLQAASENSAVASWIALGVVQQSLLHSVATVSHLLAFTDSISPGCIPMPFTVAPTEATAAAGSLLFLPYLTTAAALPPSPQPLLLAAVCCNAEEEIPPYVRAILLCPAAAAFLPAAAQHAKLQLLLLLRPLVHALEGGRTVYPSLQRLLQQLPIRQRYCVVLERRQFVLEQLRLAEEWKDTPSLLTRDAEVCCSSSSFSGNSVRVRSTVTQPSKAQGLPEHLPLLLTISAPNISPLHLPELAEEEPSLVAGEETEAAAELLAEAAAAAAVRQGSDESLLLGTSPAGDLPLGSCPVVGSGASAPAATPLRASKTARLEPEGSSSSSNKKGCAATTPRGEASMRPALTATALGSMRRVGGASGTRASIPKPVVLEHKMCASVFQTQVRQRPLFLSLFDEARDEPGIETDDADAESEGDRIMWVPSALASQCCSTPSCTTLLQLRRQFPLELWSAVSLSLRMPLCERPSSGFVPP
ncbi:hypothetical protein cyc_08174 [Cyclospora cayetanensis]|uniref:Uncharacterized protein n=1 Tax=Cyclospora cayetanensis TaxID=88456 RepID=A0A1D3CS96_9EIME|nr:hypothetical protein cyc_08174 [Cyclospora cayetanensis]